MWLNTTVRRPRKTLSSEKNQGLEILGFPANNFLEQEPGTNDEIEQFCSLNYDVHFPLFAKISVAGEDKHPLYQTLTQAIPERIGEGPWWKDLVDYGLTPNNPPEVLWNFEKFLVNKNGKSWRVLHLTLPQMMNVSSVRLKLN
jgi:glutathione peroxidase